MNTREFIEDLNNMFENGGKIAGKKYPLFVLQEIIRYAKEPNNFETISSDVFNILSYYGVNIVSHGIGYIVKN